MVRRRKRPLAKVQQFRKARWYLARGYAIAWIAEKLKVHRNTVHQWSQMTGYSLPTGNGMTRREARAVNAILKRMRSLSPQARQTILARLEKEQAA